MQTYCPSSKRKKEKKIVSKKEDTTFCLGCRDYTHNIGSKKVTTTNEVIRKKIKMCWLCVWKIKIFKTKTWLIN